MNPLGRFCPWIPYTLKTEETPALSGKQVLRFETHASRTEHRPTLCGTPSGAFVFCSCLCYSTLKRSFLSNHLIKKYILQRKSWFPIEYSELIGHRGAFLRAPAQERSRCMSAPVRALLISTGAIYRLAVDGRAGAQSCTGALPGAIYRSIYVGHLWIFWKFLPFDPHI